MLVFLGAVGTCGVLGCRRCDIIMRGGDNIIAASADGFWVEVTAVVVGSRSKSLRGFCLPLEEASLSSTGMDSRKELGSTRSESGTAGTSDSLLLGVFGVLEILC